VGKVRSAYLDVINTLNGESNDKEITENSSTDSVSTTLAANKKEELSQEAADEVFSDSWDKRMSNFKAMNIGYEESLVFAERMGRVEHMENQFLFPLTAQGSWYSMSSYIKDIEAVLSFNKNLDSRYINFLESEIKRTRKDQF